MTTKSLLRAGIRDRLRSLSPETRAALGLRIEQRVWSLPQIDSARTLLLYASMPSEVPTDAIAAEARRRHKRIVYPRCLPETTELTLHEVDIPDRLTVSNSYGVREPAPDCPLIDLADIDIAFIPGLAWDRRGNRLGRGAGYYDRLLADPAWRALRCGLFFSIQEVPTIPEDIWDQKLNHAVTETEIVSFDS